MHSWKAQVPSGLVLIGAKLFHIIINIIKYNWSLRRKSVHWQIHWKRSKEGFWRSSVYLARNLKKGNMVVKKHGQQLKICKRTIFIFNYSNPVLLLLKVSEVKVDLKVGKHVSNHLLNGDDWKLKAFGVRLAEPHWAWPLGHRLSITRLLILVISSVYSFSMTTCTCKCSVYSCSNKLMICSDLELTDHFCTNYLFMKFSLIANDSVKKKKKILLSSVLRHLPWTSLPLLFSV